jgi:hypothetical protein
MLSALFQSFIELHIIAVIDNNVAVDTLLPTTKSIGVLNLFIIDNPPWSANIHLHHHYQCLSEVENDLPA